MPSPKLCHVPLKLNEINKFQLAQPQNPIAQIVQFAGKNIVTATNPAINSHIGNIAPESGNKPAIHGNKIRIVIATSGKN